MRGAPVGIVFEHVTFRYPGRLYDPTDERILIDGTDIRAIDPWELRAHFGVLFQDFVRYFLTVREHVGFGDTRHINKPRTRAHVSRRAGIDETIMSQPDGYESLLGKVFEAGHDLSGGEWQRMALARAYR